LNITETIKPLNIFLEARNIIFTKTAMTYHSFRCWAEKMYSYCLSLPLHLTGKKIVKKCLFHPPECVKLYTAADWETG